MGLTIRTMTRDVVIEEPALTLAHEHVYCDFAAATGDPDLEFTNDEAIAADLAEATRRGVRLLVEVSTYDMVTEPAQVLSLCERAGLAVVKSTGWFRSPWLDELVFGRDGVDLARRLTDDICSGFPGTEYRAGVIGEIGITGSRPTAAEAKALGAAADAALSTGVGVVAHTDDWDNATAVFAELTGRGLPPERIMLAHARVADPVAGQQEFVDAGVTLAFDQLGHPARDGVSAVAERIRELAERGCGRRIALSADLGRRSRLRRAGGSGYVDGVRRLLDALARIGIDQSVRTCIAGGAALRFLSLPSRVMA